MSGTFIEGIVGGGRLYCRKQPSRNAQAWGLFNDGELIYVRNVSGYSDWYETYWHDQTKVGYVMKTYVDAAVHDPYIIYYNPSAAVQYALNHSTSNSSGADPNRNTAFGNLTTNDCANFVSQCLCAGGLPMFNGWSYALPNIPAGWANNSKWMLTYSGKEKLLAKGRIYEITDCTKVIPGDIIYTFDSTQDTEHQLTHVTIATSNYDSSNCSCHICGHSVNQNGNYDTKVLTPGRVKIYRVCSSTTVGSTERCVSLPGEGSGATVLV